MPVMVEVSTSVPPAASNSIDSSTAVMSAAPFSPARLAEFAFCLRITEDLTVKLVIPQIRISQGDVRTEQHRVRRLITGRTWLSDCIEGNGDGYHDVLRIARSYFGS